MPDVFLSYARSTAKQAQGVAEALKGLGYDVWWDDDLPASRTYADVIEEHLIAAKAVVVIWSAEAAKSQWVRSEADRARLDDKLVQVCLDGAALPMPFDQIQCVRLADWGGDLNAHDWRKVVASVADLVGRAAVPVRPTPQAARTQPPRWASPGRIALAAGALIATVGAIAWFALGRPGWPQPGEGVAVMSFDAATGDPLARGFADSVAEEVASSLATADLKSMPSDTGNGLTSEQRDAAAIRLGAAFALGGRVQHDGETLSVNVAIDDARMHEILWSSDFSRPASQAQALKQQVAAKVAYVLHCALQADGSVGGHISRESLRLYLQGCDVFMAGDTQQVRDIFGRVVAREPRFAAAWANFALASALAASELPADQAASARHDAQSAAATALRLDPHAGEAYVALATLDPGPGRLWERQSLLLKGLAAAPGNARLNLRESNLLGEAGRISESIAYARRAADLDPLLPYLAGNLASTLAAQGRMLEARALIEHAIAAWPDIDDLRSIRVTQEVRFGDPALALALLNDPTALPSNWEPSDIAEQRGYSLVRQSHDPAVVKAYAADLLAQVAVRKMDGGAAIRRLTPLGAFDAAFAAAAAGASAADPIDTEGLFRPTADAMRRDPRFMPLAARLGLVDFWRRSGKWPDFCEAPDRPYDCRAVAAKLAP